MDSKTFIAALTKRSGRDRKAVELLLEGVAHAIDHHCGELDVVAIPGFGNFQAEKHDEQVVTDRCSGKMMLLPPEIELTFRPGTKLRSRIELADKQMEDDL